MHSVSRGSCGNRRKCTVTDDRTCSWSVYRYLRLLEPVSHTEISVTAPSRSVSSAEKLSVLISSMSKNISSFSLTIMEKLFKIAKRTSVINSIFSRGKRCSRIAHFNGCSLILRDNIYICTCLS